MVSIFYPLQKEIDAKVTGNKSEIRSSKSETNPKDLNSNVQNDRATLVLSVSYWNFEFVSNFELRISNLIHDPAGMILPPHDFAFPI